MKIHTTQNLNSIRRNQPTDSITIPEEIRLNFLEQKRNYSLLSEPESADTVTFKGKTPKNNENAKKIINSAKKKLGDIKDKAMPETKKGDGMYKSSFFDACLELTSNEPVFSAISAAIICIFLRPLAIIALPSKDSKPNAKADDKIEFKENAPKKIEAINEIINSENKNDVAFKGNSISFKGQSKERSVTKTNNLYAAAQSISSGLAGVVFAGMISIPTKNGQDYVLKNLHKYLSADKIKELYPWVDKASLFGKDGKLQSMKFWKTEDGLKFISDLGDCQKLPVFKSLSDVSKETFEKILGVKIDFASQKGLSFNKVKDINGKDLYDVIKFDNLGIKVKEDGFKEAQILLKDLDRGYLEKLIADSKGVNEWGNLDINSVYKDGVVQDFRAWKNTEGKSWKLDLDSINVCSELETADYAPRISGAKLFDEAEQVWKFAPHLKNGEDGKLGTEITKDMVKSAADNAVMLKCLTWLPDITFRVPVAVGTIALIPWVLKNIFHLEKAKPNLEKKEDVIKEDVAKKDIETQQKNEISFKGKNNNSKNNNVSFKGKPVDPEKASGLTKLLARWYGKPLLESETMKKISKNLAKVPGDATSHMVVLGSLIQSSVYVNRTLSNKELDNDRKKTLAINQGLCFVIPTILGYIVDDAIKEKVKNIGYRYNGLMNERIASLKAAGDKASAEKAAALAEGMGKKMKGVGTLARLASFTLIYRFLVPVLGTPIANKLGDKFFSKKSNDQKVA